MKHTFSAVALVLAVAQGFSPVSAARSAVAQGFPVPSRVEGSPVSAADLLAKAIRLQESRGFMMRARMVIQAKGAAQPLTIQIRALGKLDSRGSKVLYQALWPDAYKGRAVIVEKPDHDTTTGLFFEPPDKTTPITRANFTDPIFGSDMTVEDLAENFHWWPDPVFAGQDKVGNEPCRIIESRAPAGSPSSYAIVRTCVSEKKQLILRIEKIRADGKVAKRMTVTRSARAPDGIMAPRTMEVQNLERGSTTTIDVTRGERGIIIAAADFSLARLKSLGK